MKSQPLPWLQQYLQGSAFSKHRVSNGKKLEYSLPKKINKNYQNLFDAYAFGIVDSSNMRAHVTYVPSDSSARRKILCMPMVEYWTTKSECLDFASSWRIQNFIYHDLSILIVTFLYR